MRANAIQRLKIPLLLAAALMFLAQTANAGCGTTGSGALFCLPLTFTNNQGSAVSIGTQIMIPLPANTYSSYLATNLQNIMVYNSVSGANVKCELDGNAINFAQQTSLNLATNVIIWCKSPDVIGASGGTDSNLYMEFYPTSTNKFSNSGAWGEEAQLSSAYAAYDNGNQVFNFYDDFYGTTLNTGLWYADGSATVAVNNGLTVTGTEASGNEGIISNLGTINSQTNTIDFYGYMTGAQSNGWEVGFDSGWGNGYHITLTTDGGGHYAAEAAGSRAVISPSGSIIFPQILTAYYLGGDIYGTLNYGTPSTGISWSASTSTNILMGVFWAGDTVDASWVRARTTPPNNIMPVTTYSSVQSIGVTTLTITPNPSTYGQSITLTATCSSGSTCDIDYPTLGTHIATGSGGSATYTYVAGTLGTGTYSNYYANDITGSSTSSGNTITVNQATPTITLPSFPTPNTVAYNGNQYTFTGNIVSLYNQLTANLYVDNVATPFTTQATNTILGVPGIYVVVANTLGNGNYIAATITNTLTITQASPSLAFVNSCQSPAYTGSPCTTVANIMTYNNQVQGNLYLNSIFVENTIPYISNSVSSSTNAIGTFSYVFNTIANQNYTTNSISYSYSTYIPVYLSNILIGTSTTMTKLLDPANSPYTWMTTYPVKLAVFSPSPTMNFTLMQTKGATTTSITTNALNFTYVPPSNQPTGNYIYTITEREMGVSVPVTLVVAANTLNMTDAITPLNFSYPCDVLIQELANCAISPKFYVYPNHWYIVSDNPQNGYGSANQIYQGNNIASFSNRNLTFIPTVILNYSGYGTFPANLINNPAFANSITQDALVAVANTVTPGAPNTRVLMNISAYDEQFDLSLSALTTISFLMHVNNYSISPPFTLSQSGNTFNVYIPFSDFQNPSVLVYNISTSSTAASHEEATNNYCSAIVPNGTAEVYQPNLVNVLNATQVGYQIYNGGGYGGVNDTMVVQTGASSSSARQVQSYLISSVPFTLYRQNGQPYKYLFFNRNCTLFYSTPLTVWSNPVIITLPVTANIPQFVAPQITADCNQYNRTVDSNVIGWVLCSGIDTRNFVQSWQIKVSQQEPLTPIVVNTVSINGASFSFNWTIPNMTQQYVVQVSATVDGTPTTAFVGSWAINNLFSVGALPLYEFIYGIFLILVAIFGTGYDMRVGIAASVAALLLGQALGIYNLYVTSFMSIVILGIITLFYLYSRQDQGG